MHVRVVFAGAGPRRIRAAERREGMGRAGPDGIEGEMLHYPQLEAPERKRMRAGNAGFGVPFAIGVSREMLPSETMVAGVTDHYRPIRDEVYTAVEDETGTIMVKRYRLMLPEGR